MSLLDLRAAVMEFVQEILEVIQFAVNSCSGYLDGSFVMEEALEVALFVMRLYSQYSGSLLSSIWLEPPKEAEEVEELVRGGQC